MLVLKQQKPILLLLAMMLLTGALSCAVAYRSIGNRVDQQGILREPFALIPFGYGLAVGAGLSLWGVLKPAKRCAGIAKRFGR